MPYFTQKFFHEREIRNPYAEYISFGRWTTGIQGTAILHNPMFSFAKEIFNAHLQDFDSFIDYYLIDFIIAMAYENIPDVKKEIDNVPINNVDIYSTEKHLNEPYAAYPFDKIFKDTFLHKISYKIPLDMKREDTVFREIQRRYS